MIMIPLKDWLADALAAKGLTGVNIDIALDALRKTAIDFANQTCCWEYTGQFFSQANVADYPIEVLPATRVASVAWVAVDGLRMKPAVSYAPLPLFPRGRDPNTFFSPGYSMFVVDGKEWIFIAPVPQEDSKVIEVCVALKPTQASCELPDFFLEDFNDALTAGTAFRLFAIPKQEFTNSSLAMMNQREYSREKARARQAKMQNNTQSSAILSGSYF